MENAKHRCAYRWPVHAVAAVVLLSVFAVLPALRRDVDLREYLPGPDRTLVLRRLTQQPRLDLPAQIQFLARTIRSANPEADAERLAAAIVSESRKAAFNPFLTAAVILAESRFRTSALSKAGARGLMQIQPRTASYICSLMDAAWLGADELHVPAYNIRLGIAYLKHLAKLYDNDMEKVLMAYNWGPGNMRRALSGRLALPAGPAHYSRKVRRHFEQWQNDFQPFHAQLIEAAARG